MAEISVVILAILVVGFVRPGVAIGLSDRRRQATKGSSRFVPGRGPRSVQRDVSISDRSVSRQVRARLALEECGAGRLIELDGPVIVGCTEPSFLDYMLPRRDSVEYAVRLPEDLFLPCEISCCLRYGIPFGSPDAVRLR